MSESPFEAAMRAVLGPLAFASRGEAAARVRDLEAHLASAAARAATLSIPRDARERLQQVAERFGEISGAGAERDAAVPWALERLAPFADPEYPARALARSLETLPGVGPKRADNLGRRGIRCVGDLLTALPSRYDDRRELTAVADLEVGRRATFQARVLAAEFVPMRGRFRKTFQALVGDDAATVQLKWFRGGDAIARVVRKGEMLQITGDVRRYRFQKELLHPEVEPVAGETEVSEEALPPVVADYPAFEGLHPRAVRSLVREVLENHADLVRGYLPEPLVRGRSLPGLSEALREIHLPGAEADLDALRAAATPAHERLILEELYLLQLGLALRHASQGREPGIPLSLPGALDDALQAALPFTLTAAQRRAWSEIRGDLARPHPMQRLLQGDVGSGKTVVAFLAAHACAAAGRQSALLAPTELLAEQHQRTLETLARATAPVRPLRLSLLTASLPRAEARQRREALESGALDLVVGTHALLQEQVRFAKLGLAVVDEQHRFGVMQRASLARKGEGGLTPDLLIMTATPIPRTLAHTAYGDLDVSAIDELPPGREPVRTELLREGQGPRVLEAVRAALAQGDQVYVVYPLVEESEKIDLRAASESTERIRAAFPDQRVDLVHGRQSAEERAAAMARFEAGESAILVATTVVEVGVDVPAATLMIVEHAERFGLAQLHQLRGRVGRGSRPGTCLLVARGASEDSEQRLAAMLETTDGFRIAEADLRIRGPGDMLGTRQHGTLPDLRIANLMRDTRLVGVAREAAFETVRRDPRLRRDPGLVAAVTARWGARLALAEVG